MKKKPLAVTVGIILLAFFLGACVNIQVIQPQYYKVVQEKHITIYSGDWQSPTMRVLEVHMTIKQWRDGILIYQYEHPGVLTDLGKKFEELKCSGHAVAPVTVGDALKNVTFISLGFGTPTAASTQLPGEVYRADGDANYEHIADGNWNITITWNPGGSGSTDCMGWNWLSAGDGNLWAYDTFTQINYQNGDTINVEANTQVTYQT